MIDFKTQYYLIIAVCLASYLLGSFNFARYVSLRLYHKNIETVGSGNPGAMNMTRELGVKAGLLTFLLDGLKGVAVALATYYLFQNKTIAGTDISAGDFFKCVGGLFVVLGHIFPVYFRFKGGKGISTTFGFFLGALMTENGWYALVVLGVYLLILRYIAKTNWGSMGSLIGVSVFSVWQLVLFWEQYSGSVNGYLIGMVACILAVDFLTWGRHFRNILRLLSGTERKTVIKKQK